ncbi:hypothetical protein D8Y20_00295 [Mariprofundus sp. EBB-1]|uniref:YfgM family protein n=1 Tax=Mariprofundus sp. EBB-1 TaxID=2650971 RepID=UPI000EF275AA|nr:tetratricopeptide repeat protein [Mariprofundus sp. EBB-1]RLL55922.1 hypothetical protein D8Y20_00295 [Mariprofundus sp. EBB-1]
MNDKTSEKVTVMPEENGPLKEEMDELKREMRSAKWSDWAESHKNEMIGAVAALVIVLMLSGMWIERQRAQSETAATLYQQAINATDNSEKKALLESVIKQFTSNSYAALASMQLARVDSANAEKHLQRLLQHGKVMEEWAWQARLDLAEIKIANGDKAAAKALLEQVVGKQYQQLRYYLLATLTEDAAEKITLLQKALDAVSNDAVLKQKIETLLPQQAA